MMRRNNDGAKKDRMGELRAALRELFPNDAMPKVNRYGRFRPMVDVMTLAELETATAETRLPEPMSIYGMRDATTADVQYPKDWKNGGQQAPKDAPRVIDAQLKARAEEEKGAFVPQPAPAGCKTGIPATDDEFCVHGSVPGQSCKLCKGDWMAHRARRSGNKDYAPVPASLGTTPPVKPVFGERIMTDEEKATAKDGTVYCVHDIDITVCPVCSDGTITEDTKIREQTPKTCVRDHVPGTTCGLCGAVTPPVDTKAWNNGRDLCQHGTDLGRSACGLCEEMNRTKVTVSPSETIETEKEDQMQDIDGQIEGMDKDAAELAAIMARISQKNKGALDEERVRALIADAIKDAGGIGAHVIRIEQKDVAPVEIDGQHGHFPLLHAALSARVPVMMVGPAGSGKTSAASAAAKALNLTFDLLSVGPMTGEAKFLGYMQAMGEYVETPLYRAYKNGGVFLIDEIDAGNPGVMTVLNALLANDCMTFPNGETVARHKDFIPLAAANTFGTGASREYVGRNQLDAATLDRFFFIDWPYDESLEASMMGINKPRVYREVGPSGYTAQEWLNLVTSARAACEHLKIRHVISPRAVKYGALLLNSVKKSDLLAGLIFKGLNESQVQQIKTHAGIR